MKLLAAVIGLLLCTDVFALNMIKATIVISTPQALYRGYDCYFQRYRLDSLGFQANELNSSDASYPCSYWTTNPPMPTPLPAHFPMAVVRVDSMGINRGDCDWLDHSFTASSFSIEVQCGWPHPILNDGFEGR